MNTAISSTSPPTSSSLTIQHPSTILANTFLNENDINQLPVNVKSRLYDIFGQIEKEFESLYMDNIRLRAKLNLNNDDTTVQTSTNGTSGGGSVSAFVGNLVNNSNITAQNPTTTTTTTTTSLTINTSSLPPQPVKQLISPTATTTITTIKARNTTLFPKFTNNLMQTIKNSTTNTTQNLNSNHHHHHHQANQTTTMPNLNSLLQPTITTFKEQYQVEARFRQTLVGHKDGIWDINCVQLPDTFLKNLFDLKSLQNNNLSNIQHNSSNLLIGTASADYSSRLWLLNLNQTNGVQSQSNAFCIQQYIGHQGSVNSLRFHPNFLSNNLILTASGDCQAHIWQFLLPIDLAPQQQQQQQQQQQTQLLLNDDLVNNLYNYYNQTLNKTQLYDDLYSSTDNLLRTPLNRYKTHTDVCIAADWLPDGDYIVTASWDRTSNIYNVENGKLICSLTHDDQLTNLNIHNLYNYILTSSKDTTFKLWDIRVKQQTINIYHGHTRSVNSAIFLYDSNTNLNQTNRIATTSDDHTCKIWDLRYMKQAQCQINLNSSINRLCTQTNPLTNEQILCLPLDNRDIKLYTLNGERITRLQRTNRIGHKRMINSICSKNNLLLSGSFDKQAICWSIDYNLINKSSQKSSIGAQQQTSSKNAATTTTSSTVTTASTTTTTTTSQLILPSQIATVTNTIAALTNSNNTITAQQSQQLAKRNSSSNFLSPTTTTTTSTPPTTTILTSSNTNSSSNNNLKVNMNEKFNNDNSSLIIANTNITTKKENLLNKKLISSNTNERIKI